MAAMPDNVSNRAEPAWRAKVRRFWRWWTTELLGMVPERFATFAGAARVPLLAIEEGGVTLLEPRSDEGKPPEHVQVAALEPSGAAAAVRGLLQRAGESRGRARIALAPREALVRRVTMPAATEENLGMVLGFEMDRLTPFRSDEVYHDHRVLGRDPAAGTISVLLAVARREIVEARLAQARALGVSVQGVAVREDVQRAGAPLDVLPRTERGEGEKPAERMAKQGLAIGALVLLLAALVVPVWSKRNEVYAIKPALDKAHAEAQSTDALIRELDRQVADYNFLLARKHGTHAALAYIEEVSRLLPDNTWLQQLDVKTVGKAREVVISGETVSSSKLIEILEQSRLLHNATPRGTVTRGTQPGMERFVIATEARPRPQPEAAPVTQAQAPVAAAPAYAPAQAPPESPPVAQVTPVTSPYTSPAGQPPVSQAAPSTSARPQAVPAGMEPPSQGLIFQPGGRPPSPVPLPPPTPVAPATPDPRKGPGK
jgi:general secretion pathway protein L